jgi:hypothetical protein
MTTKNDIEETTVKNNETTNEIDAIEEFEIEELESDITIINGLDDEGETVDTNEYPATDVVDLNNEIQSLNAKVGDGSASDEEETRLMALMAQRKAQRTGKSIADVTKTINAGATAILKDELEGSQMIAMNNFIATIGGPSTLAEKVATFNSVPIEYTNVFWPTSPIEAGTVDTATGKFMVQWNDSGKLTLANQRRYYANQLLLLDYIEREVIPTSGVVKGKLEGNVVRNDAGEITIGESTVTYEAKVAGGTNNVNRTGATVSTKLPTGATMWLNEPYTVNVPGYGDVTVPEFSNVGIRGLFDAKIVSTGTFKADNIKRNQGPFKELALAYKNLGYYDKALPKLKGAGTSYDATLQKALVQVGALDNYALAQRIVIKSDGNDDMSVAEFDAKIKGSIA